MTDQGQGELQQPIAEIQELNGPVAQSEDQGDARVEESIDLIDARRQQRWPQGISQLTVFNRWFER